MKDEQIDKILEDMNAIRVDEKRLSVPAATKAEERFGIEYDPDELARQVILNEDKKPKRIAKNAADKKQLRRNSTRKTLTEKEITERETTKELDLLEKKKGIRRSGKREFTAATTQFLALEQDDDKREFISKSLRNSLAFFRYGLEKPVLNDQELLERLEWYFAVCSETKQIASVEKMGLAIGYSVQKMNDMEYGAFSLGAHTAEIIHAAKQALAAQDAELAAEGRTQPVVYMFRAKNFYGMSDTKQFQIMHDRPTIGAESAETVISKYIDAAPVEDAETD